MNECLMTPQSKQKIYYWALNRGMHITNIKIIINENNKFSIKNISFKNNRFRKESKLYHHIFMTKSILLRISVNEIF